MKITNPNCKICIDPDRDEIDQMIINKTVARIICNKFPHISQMNVTNHRKHVALTEFCDVPEKLKELLNSALMSNLKPESVADIVKLLDWIEKNENKEFTSAKQQWSESFIEKFHHFENMLLGTEFFNTIPLELRKRVVEQAKSSFGLDATRDVGDWMGKMLK